MIPSTEPAQFFVGDTIKWSIGASDLQEYPPADGWLLHYVFKNEKYSNSFDATVDASGNGFDVSFDTSAMVDGTYLLLGYVDKAGERHVVRSRQVRALQNPASSEPADFRSDARKIYEKIKADEMKGVYVAEYTVGTVHCKYNTPAERDEALRKWAIRVGKEEGKVASFFGVSF